MLTNKNSSGVVVEKYIYAYDKAKNIISKEDKKGTTSYKYDSLNRLTKVTEPSGKIIEYTYDKEGNRYTETETVGTTKTKSIYSSDLRTVYIQIFTLFKFDKNLKKYNRKTTLFIVK